MMSTWIETFTERKFDIFDFKPEDIDILDIAHALSLLCRYNGHCKKFYSIAEHSYYVSRQIEKHGFNIELQLLGLLHDGSEAYISDIPRPIKPRLKEYMEIEEKIQTAIYNKYVKNDISDSLLNIVRYFDERILGDEKEQLMGKEVVWDFLPKKLGIEIACWDPSTAEHNFLLLFRDLYNKSQLLKKGKQYDDTTNFK